ncbi:PAS domain S-box protein [Pseudomonas viridiflava]|uniref:PAS domain S-box protein n=1 Tax=Pseudomonas viridiflava TaxID=33069 RepID=UPI001F62535D|nr:PAS domain S-box protein [Pseudomonas viridiflava]MCI3910594.1 PAS domain S-box protein [Pseudomonas viridiflava]
MSDFIDLKALNSERRLSFRTLPILLLMLGLLTTAVLSWWASQRNQTTTREAMVEATQRAVSVIQSRLQLYQYGLRGARGAVLTGDEHTVTREQFKRYSDSRDLASEFPGALGFGFIRRVPRPEQASFIEAARRDGMPDFSIRELSPNEGEQYVIQYVEPSELNRPAIGLDIASETNRKTAAQSAMLSGEATLTGPITLVQATGQPNQSFLFLMPIYRTGKTPETEAAKLSQAYGWSYAVLRMQDVLGDSGVNLTQVRLELEDLTIPGQPVWFYSTPSPEKSAQAIDSYSVTQAVHGRSWQLKLSIYPEFIDALHLISVSTLALSGVLTSLLIAAFTLLWSNSRYRKGQLVMARLQLATVIESSIDGIIVKTLSGTVVSWNKGAEHLFGYTSREATGQLLSSLIVPPELQDEEVYILERIRNGHAVAHFQTARQHKDGHLIQVSVSVSPMYDAAGKITGASKTLRDITKEKAAEAQVLASNLRLEGEVQKRTAELDRAQRALRTVLDGVPSMIGYWDTKLINRVANHAYQIWFGLDPETLPGSRMQDVLGEQLFLANRVYIEAVLRGKPQTFEREIPGPDGKTRHSLTHYIPDLAQGEVKGFFVIAHDVSEITESRVKLAQALREHDLLLQTINEQLLYSSTDTKGVILDVNEHFCEAHGFARDELLGRTHQLLQSGVHPESFWQSMWSTLQEGKAWHGEICNRTRDGHLCWFDTVIAPRFEGDGGIKSYIALRIDITHRRAADEEVSRLHLLLHSVLQAASEVSIIATDKDGLISVFNAGAERMLGYEASEVVDILTPAHFHLDDEIVARGQLLTKEYNKIIEGFRIFVHIPELAGAETQQWTYVRKDGSHLTISLVITPMRNLQGCITGYLGIATDITQQELHRREFAAARDQLVLAAEAAQLGIWSWMPAENTMEWNDRMFSLYATPRDLTGGDQLYNHWRSRVHPEDIVATEASLLGAIEGTGKYDPIFRALRPDGSIRYVQAGAYVERNQDGKATRITGINLDITERKEVEAELLGAKERAEQASQVKSQFLANMSHEIRTPMNGVLGMLQLLRKGGLDRRQDDYARKAQTAAQSLLGLLNDILDFSKIDADRLELDQHSFSLETLMLDLAVILSGNLAEKDIELLFDVAPQLPSVVIGDQLRLQQILINLAGNAIKFTQMGHVVVRLTELARTAGKIMLRISVVDTGIGISPAQISGIFEEFTQAETSTTRRFGGTGLGLAISKRLVQMMSSELRIDSELGKGSTFWFDIALAIDDTAPLTSIQTCTDQRRRMLVVDDNVISGQILVQTLEAFGWDVVFANEGGAAVQLVNQSMQLGDPFDAVIMDWRMPDMDGLTAASLIKNAPDNLKPPVIVMVTAFGREELADTVKDQDAPFDDFLTKPITPQQLYASIQYSLGGSGSSGVAQAGQITARQLEGLRLLVVEDNALNRQVISELLIAEGAEVTLAACGLLGVEMATRKRGEFDVVIMDVQMPDIDGMEATRRIRSNGQFASLPIVAMTANASRADRDSCLASGMNEHLGKPIDMVEVIPVLQQLAGRESERLLTESHTPPASHKNNLIEPIAKILKRLGGRLDTYALALSSFSGECERLLGELQKHSEALEARRVADTLHALRGVAATVGATALAKQAGEWEVLARKIPPNAPAPGPTLDAIASLAVLIKTSHEGLQSAFDTESISMSRDEPEESNWSPKQRIASLEELLVMLVAGDMRALDHVAALEAHTPRYLRKVIDRLVKQVRDLNFDDAIQTVTHLLTEKSE